MRAIDSIKASIQHVFSFKLHFPSHHLRYKAGKEMHVGENVNTFKKLTYSSVTKVFSLRWTKRGAFVFNVCCHYQQRRSIMSNPESLLCLSLFIQLNWIQVLLSYMTWTGRLFFLPIFWVDMGKSLLTWSHCYNYACKVWVSIVHHLGSPIVTL